jgi:hypothetical protein
MRLFSEQLIGAFDRGSRQRPLQAVSASSPLD